MSEFKVGDLVEIINPDNNPDVERLVGQRFKIYDIKHGSVLRGESDYWSFKYLKKVNNKRHKHADLMIAYANDCGLVIESLFGNVWFVVTTPSWCEEKEYRIKPEEKYYLIIEGYWGDKIVEDVGTEEEMKNKHEALKEACASINTSVVKKSEWVNGAK